MHRNGRDFITLLKDEAYSSLKKLINEGKFKYGETYSLNTIASELNMSRTPVRDAIQKLCNENIIDLLPSRGFCLHTMTSEETLQLYHFSSAIESYCASCLAKQYSKNPENIYVEKLKNLLERMKSCNLETAAFDEAYYHLDNSFHHTLIESLEDTRFNMLSESRFGFYDHPELHLTEVALNKKVILSCHELIVEAILAGDADAAYRALLEHADIVYENYKKQASNK
ncbi:HTH-type transcriptional repressor RspR [Clostridiales bacterium]|nr:HTH-type transcriptional repressor RspR [Clostridiales bacterium]